MFSTLRLLTFLLLCAASKESAGELLQNIRSPFITPLREHRADATAAFDDARFAADDTSTTPAITRAANCSDCGSGSPRCSGCKTTHCPEQVVAVCHPRCSNVTLSCIQTRCGGLAAAGCAGKCTKESAVCVMACITTERVVCGMACDSSCACPADCSSSGGEPPLRLGLATAVVVAALTVRRLAFV